jgi:Holliday junction resolvase RusA-like endonuclease
VISFTVPGVPVPQGRPRVTRTGHAYYDEKTKEYREKVKRCAEMAMENEKLLEGALALFVDCVMPIPSSWPAYRKQAAASGKWHIQRPDTDNLIKSVADSCNGVIYEDDSQLSVVIGTKSYGSVPEAKVSVYPLNGVNSPRWLIANLKRNLEAGAV